MKVSPAQTQLRRLLGVTRQMAAIAGTTVVESIQQPVALLILMTAVISILLVPIFQFHRFGEDGRLARDSGLSCILVFGLALALGTTGHAVSREIRCGTAAAALGKPLSRSVFLISKWLGVTSILALFWMGLLAATLVAERCSAHFLIHDAFTGYASDPYTLLCALGGVAGALLIAAIRHYRVRARFGVSAFMGVLISQVIVALSSALYTAFGQRIPLPHGVVCDGAAHACECSQPFVYPVALNLRVVPVAALILLALMVFAALATALATRMQPGSVLIICVTLLFLGLAGDTIKGDAPFLSMRGVLTGLLPDLQNFWLCDAIARNGRVSWTYVLEAGIHAATFCALFLLVGCAAFHNQDLG